MRNFAPFILGLVPFQLIEAKYPTNVLLTNVSPAPAAVRGRFRNVPDSRRNGVSDEAGGKYPQIVGTALGILLPAALTGQAPNEAIADITGKYHFLSPNDTLALLEEEGQLKGWMDLFQGEDESDAVLSYQLTHGTRKGDRVEFKTSKIHQKYYRFAGTVQRGAGRKEGDPDYLRLVGSVEIITVKADTGAEAVEKKAVVLKSMGKNEGEE